VLLWMHRPTAFLASIPVRDMRRSIFFRRLAYVLVLEGLRHFLDLHLPVEWAVLLPFSLPGAPIPSAAQAVRHGELRDITREAPLAIGQDLYPRLLVAAELLDKRIERHVDESPNLIPQIQLFDAFAALLEQFVRPSPKLKITVFPSISGWHIYRMKWPTAKGSQAALIRISLNGAEPRMVFTIDVTEDGGTTAFDQIRLGCTPSRLLDWEASIKRRVPHLTIGPRRWQNSDAMVWASHIPLYEVPEDISPKTDPEIVTEKIRILRNKFTGNLTAWDAFLKHQSEKKPIVAEDIQHTSTVTEAVGEVKVAAVVPPAPHIKITREQSPQMRKVLKTAGLPKNVYENIGLAAQESLLNLSEVTSSHVLEVIGNVRLTPAIINTLAEQLPVLRERIAAVEEQARVREIQKQQELTRPSGLEIFYIGLDHHAEWIKWRDMAGPMLGRARKPLVFISWTGPDIDLPSYTVEKSADGTPRPHWDERELASIRRVWQAKINDMAGHIAYINTQGILNVTKRYGNPLILPEGAQLNTLRVAVYARMRGARVVFESHSYEDFLEDRFNRKQSSVIHADHPETFVDDMEHLRVIYAQRRQHRAASLRRQIAALLGPQQDVIAIIQPELDNVVPGLNLDALQVTEHRLSLWSNNEDFNRLFYGAPASHKDEHWLNLGRAWIMNFLTQNWEQHFFQPDQKGKPLAVASLWRAADFKALIADIASLRGRELNVRIAREFFTVMVLARAHPIPRERARVYVEEFAQIFGADFIVAAIQHLLSLAMPENPADLVAVYWESLKKQTGFAINIETLNAIEEESERTWRRLFYKNLGLELKVIRDAA
jgi:hypothetical protein